MDSGLHFYEIPMCEHMSLSVYMCFLVFFFDSFSSVVLFSSVLFVLFFFSYASYYYPLDALMFSEYGKDYQFSRICP